MSDANRAAHPQVQSAVEITSPLGCSSGSHELQGRLDRSASTRSKTSTFVAHTAMLEVRSWRPLSSDERRTIADNTRILALVHARAVIGMMRIMARIGGTHGGNTLTRSGNVDSRAATARIVTTTGQRGSVKVGVSVWAGSTSEGGCFIRG